MEPVKIVLPVRFSAGTHAIQTTTSEMGTTGVFVRTLQILPVGMRVELLLQLPNEHPLDLRAVVRKGAKKERGFWAAFVDLAPEALQRIERAIAAVTPAAEQKSPEPSQPSEPPQAAAAPAAAEEASQQRRVFPRHAAQFQVDWAPIGELRTSYSVNVSSGGVFLQTNDPPQLGATLLMTIDLPGATAPVGVQGFVVQRTTREDARASPGRVPGVGIQFLDTTDAFRDALNHFLAELERKKKA